MKSTTEIERARFIATIAHTAQGGKRSDGITPYISHPERVAELTISFWADLGCKPTENPLSLRVNLQDGVCAAWLHDVVEDTAVTLDNLRAWGMSMRVVEIVDLLTKKNLQHEAETEEYYAAIARDDTAILVKCADRAANLEDSLQEVKQSRDLKRWANYVSRTYTDVLPMYASLPELRAELTTRLKAIEDAIIEARGGDPNGTFNCGVPI